MAGEAACAVLQNFNIHGYSTDIPSPLNNDLYNKNWSDDIYSSASSSYRANILQNENQAGHDAGSGLQKAMLKGEMIRQQQAALLRPTKGVIGELQKQNYLAALAAQNIGTRIEIAENNLMERINGQLAKQAIIRHSATQAAQNKWYGYDPYHPTEFDQKMMQENGISTDKNTGFVPFGH